MIYYSFSSVLRGVVMSVSAGALIAFISVMLDTVFEAIGAFFGLPKSVIFAASSKENAKKYLSKDIDFGYRKRAAGMFIKDALFSITTGFLLSLLLYLATDGEIRVYIFLLVLISYVLTRKTIGALLYAVCQRVVWLALRLVGVALLMIVFPLSMVTRRICSVIKRIATAAFKKRKSKR